MTIARLSCHIRQLTKEIMEIQDKITQIKSRQLGRLISQLKAINSPQITIDGVEKYFNYFYLDILEAINQDNKSGKSGNYDKSSNKF